MHQNELKWIKTNRNELKWMKIIKNELNVIKTTELYTKTELKRTKINKTSDVSSSQDCVELIVREQFSAELDENHKIGSEIWHPPVEGTVVYPHYLQFFLHPNRGCLGILNHQQ